jgi:hypothetical protein
VFEGQLLIDFGITVASASPPARASALSTSSASYAAAVATGQLSKARAEVVEALRMAGPMTGAELDAWMTDRGGRGHYHKRLSELRRAGAATDDGARPCRVTGRKALVWRAL